MIPCIEIKVDLMSHFEDAFAFYFKPIFVTLQSNDNSKAFRQFFPPAQIMTDLGAKAVLSNDLLLMRFSVLPSSLMSNVLISKKNSFLYISQWCRKMKKIGAAGSDRWGYNLPSPGWNRVNWSTKYWRGHTMFCLLFDF